MVEGKLVSILTPCYNGESYVERFLNSILNQTYKKIELIFVDDGSSDKTADIVNTYKGRFKDQGMILFYIYQENKGQAAAINTGLKYINGEYLTWPDSDDYLPPLSIEKKVEFLEGNLDFGFVRTNAIYVDSVNLNKVSRLAVLPKRFDSHLYDGFIQGTQFYVCGCYMVRMSDFLDVNPNREIEFSFVGQNLQMLLPISYSYKCGFIDEDLYWYVNTPNSHSRVKCDYEQALFRCNEYYRLLQSVSDTIMMTENERLKYFELIKLKLHDACLMLTITYSRRNEYVQLSLSGNADMVSVLRCNAMFYVAKLKCFFMNKLKNFIKIIVNSWQ